MRKVLKELLMLALVIIAIACVIKFFTAIDNVYGTINTEYQEYTTEWGTPAPKKFQTDPEYLPVVILKALKYAQNHTYAYTYLKVSKELKYTNKVPTPRVSVMEAGILNLEMGCKNQACLDLVTGFYDFNTRTIFLDERVFQMDSVLLEALLVHESVHYLQHQHGVPDPKGACEVMKILEKEAWSVQRRYLHRYRAGYMFRTPTMICLDDGGVTYQL